jgi:hypothetical protein
MNLSTEKPKINFFTYFSSGYVIPGITAIESFLITNTNSIGFVVCLDNESYEILSEIFVDKRVKVYHIDHFSYISKKLFDYQNERSYAESLISIKPELMHRIMTEIPDSDYLIYIDADLFFTSSIELILPTSSSEIGLLSQHQFSKQQEPSYKYGTYNAGLIILKSCDESIDLLLEWAKKCDEWCFLWCENGKFADQGYLNELSNRSGIVSDATPGLNNGVYFFQYSKRKIERRSGKTYIEDSELICFHFHGFKMGTRTIWTGINRYGKPRNFIRVFLYVYFPYIKSMWRNFQKVERIAQDMKIELMKVTLNQPPRRLSVSEIPKLIKSHLFLTRFPTAILLKDKEVND